MLLLGVDQCKKVIDRSNQSYEVKNYNTANDIIKKILLLPDDTKKTIMLFASPQAIVDKAYWKEF